MTRTCPDTAACANGKCQQTGTCIDAMALPLTADQVAYLNELAEEKRAEWVASPPLQPTAPTRRIVAFTGLAGSGKSTAAKHLIQNHGWKLTRFAGPLKAMMTALGLTYEEIEGSRKELPCELLGGKTPRWAMQSIGTEWGRNLIDPDLWIRAWRAALPVRGNVVVDDCRFPNEAAAVRAAGGIIIRVARDGAVSSAAGHSSEGQEIEADFTIRNDRRMSEFLADVEYILTPHLQRSIQV